MSSKLPYPKLRLMINIELQATLLGECHKILARPHPFEQLHGKTHLTNNNISQPQHQRPAKTKRLKLATVGFILFKIKLLYLMLLGKLFNLLLNVLNGLHLRRAISI